MSDPTAPAAEQLGADEQLDATRESKRREAKRERDRVAAANRRAAAKGGAAPAAVAAPPPAEQLDASRTDAQRTADAATFLALVFSLLGAIVGVFGWELAPLTEDEATRDAPYWVPVARRYRSFDLVITWAAAPASLVRRVRAKLRRRDVAPAAASPSSSATSNVVQLSEARP